MGSEAAKIIGFLGALLLAGCGGREEPPGPSSELGNSPAPPANVLQEDAPNVVLILIDTLRADHLAPYGYDRRAAPFLAGLARRSVVFQHAYSTSSWTGPSTASLFTGLYPTRHGLTRGFFAQKGMEDAVNSGGEAQMDLTPLPEFLQTLPMLMQQMGYTTFGMAANINIGPELGFSRGFDRFRRSRKEEAEEMARELRKWLPEMRKSEPSFLYLHFNDVHKPYNKRKPWYEQKAEPVEDAIAAYDSELRFVDRCLKSLYEDCGWDENTILWIVSDHGEEFMDHGEMGHGFSLFQELMQVVGMVYAPGIEPGSVEVNVSLIDVLPTLMDWLDVDLPDERDGRSLLPLLRAERSGEAEREFGQRILFAHRKKRAQDAVKWAALFGSWKLIHDVEADEWALFNLLDDPDELVNQFDAHPELVEVLRSALDRLKERQSLGSGSVEIPLDETMLEHLRALGYAEEEEGG